MITSAPSEADQEALKSPSVGGDEELEEAPDLRFVPAWVGLSERRSAYFTEAMLKRALEELEFFSRELRILGVYPADPFRERIREAAE